MTRLCGSTDNARIEGNFKRKDNSTHELIGAYIAQTIVKDYMGEMEDAKLRLMATVIQTPREKGAWIVSNYAVIVRDKQMRAIVRLWLVDTGGLDVQEVTDRQSTGG